MNSAGLQDKVMEILTARKLNQVPGYGAAVLDLVRLIGQEKSMSYNLGYTDGARRITRGA